MKTIITLFAIVGMIAFTSCTGPEGPTGQDGLTAQAFELNNKNLVKVADNEYNYSSTFQKEIGGNLYDDETVLVYRSIDFINSTTPVWELLPRTINFNNGDFLESYFDFSKVDFVITLYGNYNLLNRSSYIDNQTFRVVILPSALASSIDTKNYLEVMTALKINESQVQKVNF